MAQAGVVLKRCLLNLRTSLVLSYFAPAPAHLPGVNQSFWRDKLSQLLESTAERIFGIDMDGCRTFVNQAGASNTISTVPPAHPRKKTQKG